MAGLILAFALWAMLQVAIFWEKLPLPSVISGPTVSDYRDLTRFGQSIEIAKLGIVERFYIAKAFRKFPDEASCRVASKAGKKIGDIDWGAIRTLRQLETCMYLLSKEYSSLQDFSMWLDEQAPKVTSGKNDALGVSTIYLSWNAKKGARPIDHRTLSFWSYVQFHPFATGVVQATIEKSNINPNIRVDVGASSVFN